MSVILSPGGGCPSGYHLVVGVVCIRDKSPSSTTSTPTSSSGNAQEQMQLSGQQQLQSLTTNPPSPQTPPATETISSKPHILPCLQGQYYDIWLQRSR